MIDTIYFIRHAKTEANGYKDKTLCGSTDLSITQRGKEMAEQASKVILLENHDIAKLIQKQPIYTSCLRRTQETAKAMFGDDISYIPVKEFNEISFGDYELCKESSVPTELFEIWKNTPEKCQWPNGDSVFERTEKAYEKLKSIAKDAQYPVLIVTSGLLMRLLITRTQNLPLHNFLSIPVGNCDMWRIIGFPDKVELAWFPAMVEAITRSSLPQKKEDNFPSFSF